MLLFSIFSFSHNVFNPSLNKVVFQSHLFSCLQLHSICDNLWKHSGKRRKCCYPAFFSQCFLPISKQSSVFQSHLFWGLQMRSVWTTLQICHLVELQLKALTPLLWIMYLNLYQTILTSNSFSPQCLTLYLICKDLHSSNSATDENMLSKIWTNGV